MHWEASVKRRSLRGVTSSILNRLSSIDWSRLCGAFSRLASKIWSACPPSLHCRCSPREHREIDVRHEAPYVPHAAGQRGGGVAARGASATTGEDSTNWDHRRFSQLERLPAGAARSRLPGRAEHRLRVSL